MMLAEQAQSWPETNRRVLVVDDDRYFAESLSTLLKLEGYDIGIAHSALRARQIIEAFEAQVAILDFRLGSTVGVDLIRPLTERRPGLVCILLTAYEDVDTVVRALRCGAYDYIRKPVREEELFATLDRCFEKRRLMAAKEAAEEALREARKMEAVAQIAGGVAHHFNNTLAAIHAGVELLLDDRLADSDRAAYAGNVLKAVMRAANINQSLLGFARRQALRPTEFDLNEFLTQLTIDLKAELGGSITVTLAVAAGLGCARLDRDQLGTAIRHLASNARDAMLQGGRLTIEADQAELAKDNPALADDMPPGRYVAIAVSDTGAGIPPDIKDRVFEPFFTSRGRAEAAGLGLSMVYGFVKQSGGGVSIESAVGKGTIVRLLLPQRLDD